MIDRAALLLTVLFAGHTWAVEVQVRFEIEGLPLPEGTTFPRLPAGLGLFLIPEVRLQGSAGALSREQAEATGLALQWWTLEPALAATSNLQRSPSGHERIAATPLQHRLRRLAPADPWRVDADLLAQEGTVRLMLTTSLRSDPRVASTPGPQSQYELAPGVAGGLATNVVGFSRRPSEHLEGIALELGGLPFVLNPLGEPAELHQTERRAGMDCTSTFVYAMRRLGADVPYVGPASVWPYLRRLTPRSVAVNEEGVFVNGREPVQARPGDFLHFGNQLSLLVQDRWPFGVLDGHDILVQSWKSSPRAVSIRESGYAASQATLVRFREDVPRLASAKPSLRVEDSHAGSFFHLLPSVRAKPVTLVLIDAHSDAGQHPFSGEFVHHEPTAAWLRRLRDLGRLQPFNWVDALIPWGVAEVLWLGPWDETDRAEAERAAKRDLCELSRLYPNHGFECRSDRFRTVSAAELEALPSSTPAVISVDLDFLLRRDGAVDQRRATQVRDVLEHFERVSGASAALSRPYFPSDSVFEDALRLFSAAVWSSQAVGAVEVDLSEEQRDDRSLQAQKLMQTGVASPRPRPEQIDGTPGLRLIGSQASATFGLIGDVYLSDSTATPPPTLPFEARRGGFGPVEKVPLFANLETPVVATLPPQGYPRFNQTPALLAWLAAQGVVLVSVANNHALDQGVNGLHETIRAARDRGIGVVGAWLPGEAAQGVERLQFGRLSVACLGVTATLNAPGPLPEGLDVVPFESYPLDPAARAAEERFLEKVRSAARSADLVTVIAHSGTEYSSMPSLGQRRFFEALAQAGARVVAGVHSHRAGPVDGTGTTLFAWGLGDAFPRRGASGLGLRVTAERREGAIEVRFERMRPKDSKR